MLDIASLTHSLTLLGKITRMAAPRIELADLLPSWVVWLQAEGKSFNTVDSYRRGVGQYLTWCETTGAPVELTRNNVAAFIASLLGGGSQPATAAARFRAVRRFSAWLTAEGELDADPMLGMSRPKLDVKVVTPLTDDQLGALVAACQGKTLADRRDEAIVRLMAETGMRGGECATLKLADIDIVGGRAIVVRGKGGKGRVVPFSPQTATAIDRYIRVRRGHSLAAGSSLLWLGERGKGFKYDAMHRALGQRAIKAGIEGFHPHKLRHTAATRWLRAGGSEGGLMAVAGWAKRDMLDRYTAATAADRATEEARGLKLGEF
jgi:integrase/recombinase XerD